MRLSQILFGKHTWLADAKFGSTIPVVFHEEVTEAFARTTVEHIENRMQDEAGFFAVATEDIEVGDPVELLCIEIATDNPKQFNTYMRKAPKASSPTTIGSAMVDAKQGDGFRVLPLLLNVE